MMEFQLSYFKSLKMMLWKCFTQYASKFGENSCGHNWKRSVCIPIPKKSNAKECSNYQKTILILHTSKVMLQILQARLQQYVNHELQDVQDRFRKGRGTRDQIANIHWIIKKSKRDPEKCLLLLYLLCQSLWLCESQQTVDNSRDGNTRPLDLPPEKSVCKSRRNS